MFLSALQGRKLKTEQFNTEIHKYMLLQITQYTATCHPCHKSAGRQWLPLRAMGRGVRIPRDVIYVHTTHTLWVLWVPALEELPCVAAHSLKHAAQLRKRTKIERAGSI